MTDKEKLEKIKALADKMYSRMAYLTSDTMPIRQAMDEYHQFIINEYHKEEPVSEKECMYSKDNFTDEDRKVLCDGYEEECKYVSNIPPVFDEGYWERLGEKPINGDLEKIVEEIVDPTVLNAYGVKEITNRLRRTMIEPVSEDLEEAAKKYGAKKHPMTKTGANESAYDFKAGANWHEQQLMAKAVDVEVKVDAGGYPYIPQMELYDYEKDIPLAKEGDKYKVVLIKEG